MFNGRLPNNIYWSQCLYVALDYVINAWECLDSCCIASSLCNNVDLNVHLGTKGLSGTDPKEQC